MVLIFTRRDRGRDKDITCQGKSLDLSCTPPSSRPSPPPLPTKIVVWRQGFFLSFAHNYAPFHLPPCSPWPLHWGQWPGYPTLLGPIMCLLGWMKRGIHARADRRAARRVITPSHSALVCPSSCPNTQTARLTPYIKDLDPNCTLSSSTESDCVTREKHSGLKCSCDHHGKPREMFHKHIWRYS